MADFGLVQEQFNNLTGDIELNPASFGLFMRDIEEASLNLKTAIYSGNVNLTADIYKQIEKISEKKYSLISPDGTLSGNYYERYLTENGELADYTMGGKSPGLYMDHQRLGYWNGTDWKAYIANNGNAFFGSDLIDNYLYWDGSILKVRGDIEATSATFGYISPGGAASDINNNTTTISGGKITTGSITAAQINVSNLFAQTITATGSITGATISTSGTGARIEMSNTDDFRVYDSNGVVRLRMSSDYNDFGYPAIGFFNSSGSNVGQITGGTGAGIFIKGSFTPHINGTYNLGESSLRWGGLYIYNIDATGNITSSNNIIASNNVIGNTITSSTSITANINITAGGTLTGGRVRLPVGTNLY